MINGLEDVLKASIISPIIIYPYSLNYARNFLLTMAEVDHRLNQLQNGS